MVLVSTLAGLIKCIASGVRVQDGLGVRVTSKRLQAAPSEKVAVVASDFQLGLRVADLLGLAQEKPGKCSRTWLPTLQGTRGAAAPAFAAGGEGGGA